MFLIICGVFPEIGGIIRPVPIEVLGAGVIVMFGMVVAAGNSMSSDVDWNRRNLVIFAIFLSVVWVFNWNQAPCSIYRTQFAT